MRNHLALEKRIKRHVVGRMREYFVATAPGLESVCLQELSSSPLTVHEAKICPGGVVFHGRLVDCYRANLYLRTAGRVLMRIGTFKAAGFHELEKKCSGLPWELFLGPQQEVAFRIRAKKSRLYHSGAIADRFQSGISDRMASTQPPHEQEQRRQPQTIFVRAVDNRFTVSLDSSGVNLHKRGLKKSNATAPLRETTAAAILMLAGYCPPDPLLDPMCGSGTFSTEAAMRASNIPAGWFREFAFTGWPAHRQTSRRWEHLKTEAGKRIAIPKRPVVLASDIDRRACDIYKQSIQGHLFSAAIDISPGDFFNSRPPQLTHRRGLVVINPPYGRRIKAPEGTRTLLERIGNKLIRDFGGWKFALVVPAKSMLGRVSLSAEIFPIFHGGLQVFAAIGQVPPTADHGKL